MVSALQSGVRYLAGNDQVRSEWPKLAGLVCRFEWTGNDTLRTIHKIERWITLPKVNDHRHTDRRRKRPTIAPTPPPEPKILAELLRQYQEPTREAVDAAVKPEVILQTPEPVGTSEPASDACAASTHAVPDARAFAEDLRGVRSLPAPDCYQRTKGWGIDKASIAGTIGGHMYVGRSGLVFDQWLSLIGRPVLVLWQPGTNDERLITSISLATSETQF